MSLISSLPRSSSSHHISSSVGHLSHYGSAIDPAIATSATPHLSHLRQSSSVAGLSHQYSGGVGNHHHADEQHHHSHYPTQASLYDVYEEIGVGAFATVYHAAIRETGEQVAIKVIDLDQFNTNWEEIRREILIMSLVHHPNVVRILTSFVEGQDLWLIMPLLEVGSCAHVMKTIYPTGMKDEVLIATILHEVLSGLLYFHKDGRLHRDLKAGNVLISAEGEVQLADFGVAGTLLENGDRKKARRTFTGTPCWMAPEVMEHAAQGYDEKADIWSFGILSMELAYGRAPYAKFPPMKVMVLTLQEEPPTCDIYKDHSYEFSRHFHQMIAKCLRKDPTKRPNVKKLLEHKFFKQAKDGKYLIEKIVKKMPHKKLPQNGQTINICELRGQSSQPHELEPEKGKPVSVGSWVFDKAEFDEMKRQAIEKKESEGPHGQRFASVQASYADEETPKGRDRTGRMLPVGGSSSHLAAQASSSPPHRVPSTGHESSGDSSDADEGHDDEEDTHRPLPDFSDPNQFQQPQQQQTNLNVEKPRDKSVSPQPNNTVPGGAASPCEQRYGKFLVSDDAEDDTQQEYHPDQSAYQQEGQSEYNEAHAYHQHGQQQEQQPQPRAPLSYIQEQSESHQSSSAFPAFHNDAYDEDEPQLMQNSLKGHGDVHEHHVGRFAVCDD